MFVCVCVCVLQKTVSVPCAVITQPDSYKLHVNCGKFLCLLHHMLQGLSSPLLETEKSEARCRAAKQHLLDLPWLVTKLDATSLVQLLDDLQMAITTATTMASELSWLQLLVARQSVSLAISGRQLHTWLHVEMAAERGLSGAKRNRRLSFTNSLQKLETAVANSPIVFFVLHQGLFPSEDLSASVCSTCVDGTALASPTDPLEFSSKPVSCVAPPVSCLNGFFCQDRTGRLVVSLSSRAGTVVVWNTAKNEAVTTLRDVNKPSDLVFLDEKRVVVLCNRELKAYDLESGTLISSIRGMLNIKMPYFQVRDANTVIFLSRNRMSVNVLDVHTGQIHATFKAGEDRFLNSLLVSGDGNMLVCGDETQKPFPLLVWELGQSKLLHDLRMPQHEFITSIAAITRDGHYVACACRVSSEPAGGKSSHCVGGLGCVGCVGCVGCRSGCGLVS